MPTYASPLSPGKTSPKGFNRILTKLFTSQGVIEPTAMQVSAQVTPDMSVRVSGSSDNDNAAFVAAGGHFINAWNSENANVTISPNTSGVTKTDAIVAYIDLEHNVSTPLEDMVSDNPGSVKLVAVRRSGTLTGAPNSSEIEAVAGLGNPYMVLAHVTVANGASSINSGNVSDQRTFARMSRHLLEPLGTDQYGDGSVTPVKRVGGFKVGTIAIASNGTRVVTGLGFKPKLVRFFLLPQQGALFSYGQGNYDGINQFSAGGVVSGANSARTYRTDCCLIVPLSSDPSDPNVRVVGVSLDTDGFTVNVTNSTSSAPFMAYEAYA